MKHEYLVTDLNEKPELIDSAASWFHHKWGVPKEAYLDSMTKSLTSKNKVPSWYIILNNQEEIIAGIGVIQNDFHDHPNLTPNICALYVEESYRKNGIAKILLDTACNNLSYAGINKTYLITTHTNFYERYGWKFYGMVKEDDGNMIRMYEHENQSIV